MSKQNDGGPVYASQQTRESDGKTYEPGISRLNQGADRIAAAIIARSSRFIDIESAQGRKNLAHDAYKVQSAIIAEGKRWAAANKEEDSDEQTD